MMFTITCPSCKTEGKFSILESKYLGPYKCWKCRDLFQVLIENNELKQCEPLTQEELEKQQEVEALKAKFQQK